MNSGLYLQVHSMGCCGLQIVCLLHYHTSDSVLTCGCFFISEHIQKMICIMLAILGIWIKTENLGAGKRSMWIHICRQQFVKLGSFTSHIDMEWHGWRSGQRWCPLWYWLSVLARLRWTGTFAPAGWLRNRCGAIVAWNAAVHVVVMKHSWVSFIRSLPLSMSRKLNSPVPLFLYFSVTLSDQVLRFLYCGAQKPPFGHVGYFQGQAHNGLF